MSVLSSAKGACRASGFIFLGFKGYNFANRSFHFRYSMEDLSRKWGKLSLTEKEKAGYVLPKTQRKYEFMIAAKFLTPRALNMDAVGRTFKQVWQCSDGFKIRNMSDHKALFVFDDECDVTQILANQPWRFDKHLVLVKRYDKDIPLRSVTF